MANTTTAQVVHGVNNFYSRTMLERGLPLLVHDLFAQLKDIPKKNTNVIKFRRYGALTVATTPLTEGVTPAGSQLSITDITATVNQYGDFVTITDWLGMTSLDPLQTETAELLGEQAGQTLDTIIRDIIAAGTNAQYADAVVPGSNTATNQVASTDLATEIEYGLAVRTLKNANARRITSMVSPDRGFNTTPVDASYVAIIHPNTTHDLLGLSNFVPVEKYGNKTKLLPGEAGKIRQIRFIETTFGNVKTASGAGSIDVYTDLIFGMHAYGVTRISGEALRTIRKELGSGGTADPLDQRATMGWKATLTAIILNQTFMIRLEHAVS